MGEVLSLEQEMGFFKQVVNYEDYKISLSPLIKACKTQEQLDTAKTLINEVRARLMDTNPEFKDIMDKHKQTIKMEAEETQALHRAKMAEHKAEASRIRSEALSKVKDSDVEDWVNRTRIKTYDPDEKQKELDAGIGCPNPKCDDHGKNRGNTINNVPTCMGCYHRLVSKDEFKNYNRKYWRRFNKNKK